MTSVPNDPATPSVSATLADTPVPNAAFEPTIMAVDDEDSVRLSLKYFLKDRYKNVLLCASVAEAMAAMAKAPVHVAILDIKMVGESGLDLLRAIKSHDPFVECIMLTAFETGENIKEAMRRGASEFLHKPPQMHTLLEAIAKAVERRRRTERMREVMSRATSIQSDLFALQCGIIHDLKNEITVIAGMLSLAESRVEAKKVLDENGLNALRSELMAAQRAANVCIEMTTHQLEVVRSVSDEPSALPASLYDIAKDIAESLSFHPEAKFSDINVVKPSEPLPHVQMPPVAAFQLIMNLMLNGAQARRMPPNKNRVTVSFFVEHEPAELSRSADTASSRWIGTKTFHNKPPFVRVLVSDGGTGIPSDILPKLFTQNFSTKRSGSGVGLWLVAKLCTDYNILLSVSTQLNVGTTFSLLVPTVNVATKPITPAA
jgi:signal transduction histidine kinase